MPSDTDGIKEFATLMKVKIEAKEVKYGSFQDYAYSYLVRHLWDEINELDDAICLIGDEATAREAVDVANLAYMIWRKASKKNAV